MAVLRQQTVTPSAARLTESLRDIGYDFRAAVADMVDNSIAAEARQARHRRRATTGADPASWSPTTGAA